MKSWVLIIGLGLAASGIFAQDKSTLEKWPNPRKELVKVEAACGQCQFGMEGKGCDLAIRFKGRAYFVKGTKIDDHGDAHAQDGFCQTIRKAEVQGELQDDKFGVTYFQLTDASKEAKPK